MPVKIGWKMLGSMMDNSLGPIGDRQPVVKRMNECADDNGDR